jgi:hypothetical protein
MLNSFYTEDNWNKQKKKITRVGINLLLNLNHVLRRSNFYTKNRTKLSDAQCHLGRRQYN